MRYPPTVLHAGDPVIEDTLGRTADFFYHAKASGLDRIYRCPVCGARRLGERPDCGHPLEQMAKHPTGKPVALMSALIKLYSPPNGIVLDPFAGAGPTLQAAEACGRRSVGVERYEPYWLDAVARLQQLPSADPHMSVQAAE